MKIKDNKGKKWTGCDFKCAIFLVVLILFIISIPPLLLVEVTSVVGTEHLMWVTFGIMGLIVITELLVSRWIRNRPYDKSCKSYL